MIPLTTRLFSHWSIPLNIFLWFSVSSMFLWLLSSLRIGNYKENAYPPMPSEEFLSNSLFFFLLYIQYMFTFFWLPSKYLSLSLASLLFCILIPGYRVIPYYYLWLPCYSVFLSLATLSFCIIIRGYPVILYSYLWLPCHSALMVTMSFCIRISGYHVILYLYLWLPCYSVFLSLASMSFCILIFGFHVTLYQYPWLPCHSVFLTLASLSCCIPGYPVIRYPCLWPFCILISYSSVSFLISSYPVISVHVLPYIFPATLPFRIYISRYPVILYPHLWLPHNSISLYPGPQLLFPGCT